jgi:SAM-dependent MidA family methyltransferase
LNCESGNLALIEIIRDKIRRDGPQPFAWFMEQALYHPAHGYYSSDRAEIGRDGDYFTNVSVGPLFGQLLAIQFVEIWQAMGKMERFSIVEQGAHHGQFARDVLEFSRRRFPDFFSALTYRIIESFPKLRDRQQDALKEFSNSVQWSTSLGELEPFVGVHFSNELLDAMPINLRGKLVGLNGDNFGFVKAPTDQILNQTQLDWIEAIAKKLKRGFVLAIDYGFSNADFHEVLQVRARHRLVDSPFNEIGQADVTAHVNWTDIAKAGERYALWVSGFTDQHHFLTGIISAFPEIVADEKSKRALQTLLHPEMLGRSFQVLALSKDVDPGVRLKGFKFARDPRKTLSL